MFRQKPKDITELTLAFLRQNGLETPLLQKRLVDSWASVVGATIAGYTRECSIRNQTLFVKLNNPALRADLNMMRTELVKQLNEAVGAHVIYDIRIS